MASPSSLDTSPTAGDATIAYGRQELTLSCTGLASPFIDVDEPRVLPSAGADIRYLCLDQRFELQDGAVAGYVDSTRPASLDHCRQGLRQSAFDHYTGRITAGLSFCINPKNESGSVPKTVRVDVLTDGFGANVRVAFTGFYRNTTRS